MKDFNDRIIAGTESSDFTIRVPKIIARVTICGCVTYTITDNMQWIQPTPEQIKNLKQLFNIDVEILEEE